MPVVEIGRVDAAEIGAVVEPPLHGPAGVFLDAPQQIGAGPECETPHREPEEIAIRQTQHAGVKVWQHILRKEAFARSV